MTLHALSSATPALRPRRPHGNSNGQTGQLPSASPSVTQEPQSWYTHLDSPTHTKSQSISIPTLLMTPRDVPLYPTTVTWPSSTYVSYYPATVTTQSPYAIITLQSLAPVQPVCIGHGLDATADGIIATAVLPSAVGTIVWLLFACVRPRYRQLYAAREWFTQQDLRPRPLSSAISAFLFPPLPLIPSIPSDVSSAGRSPATDAKLFPSDEQLTQRILWISLLVAIVWSIVGLGGALPLFMISTPCLAQSTGTAQYSGVFSVIQDLSVLRLLQLLNADVAPTSILTGLREVVNGVDEAPNARLRIIILTVLTIFVSTLPSLGLVLREFHRMAAFRKRWLEVRCGGQEVGWLSACKAPGYSSWGEKEMKDHLIKLGLSSYLEGSSRRQASRPRHPPSQSQSFWRTSQNLEASDVQVNVQALFSICDTHNLALLIAERDEILDNLEVAEAKYISSFRLSTPDPSIADLELPPRAESSPLEKSEKSDRPYISRPRALTGSRSRQRPRRHNPAHANSSFAPTSFVAPSQYYKLRGIRSLNGGRFTDGMSTPISLTDSIQQRIVGSRFQEVNRDSVVHDRLPLGSRVKIDKDGVMGPSSPIPDPRYYGPNHTTNSIPRNSKNSGTEYVTVESSLRRDVSLDAEWVDLLREVDFGSSPVAGSSRIVETSPLPKETNVPPARPRPLRAETTSSDHRETFPLRIKTHDVAPESIPPHLRLQPQQPFVRPASGLDYDDLGAVYAEINQWRSRLKTINGQISDAQQDCYVDIAEGSRIKGWIFIGRGLRYMPGLEIIEGRAKEDIRWDVLQHEPSTLDVIAMWTLILVVIVLLASGLTAASGLALGMAPNISHYLPFFQTLSIHDGVASGLATCLVPAFAVCIFICIAVSIIGWAAQWNRVASVFAVQFLTLKILYTVFVAVAALVVTVGSLLFALGAFSEGREVTKTIADGLVYMGAFALVIVLTVAVIVPGLLLLQPVRLLTVLRSEKHALTPRQRFRALYPRSYNLPYSSGACVVGIVFASAYSLIFPLIGPAVAILLFMSLIAHRFLIGYVHVRTLPQTGALMQIWLLERFGSILALQPLLLGLLLLSRQLWIEGGVLVGLSLLLLVGFELYTAAETRKQGLRTLQSNTRESLEAFSRGAKPSAQVDIGDESTSHLSSNRAARTRGSMASVLEMMSLTLAVVPPASRNRGPLPLPTETLDDLTATERAARTHPDAPPRLPALPFADHAEEMTSIFYAPELLAPHPIIWLPNDSAGVARSEAADLQKYHDLRVTLDVGTQDAVFRQRFN
ncbi:hypothetical protein F5I97DRAFT_1876997 [Phlebopus sp. FC_14]|nr:hypothetical protein F5I97DRAFT_1876997 [Phlebopus sp. FC_14]